MSILYKVLKESEIPKDFKRLMIKSHRRSGNNFLRYSLERNYKVYCNIKHNFNTRGDLSIVRDPRDVLLSTYFWWRTREEDRITDHVENLGCSFKEFLDGKMKYVGEVEGNYCIRGVWYEGYQLQKLQFMFDDPAGYLQEMTQGIIDNIDVIVIFDDLKNNQLDVVKKLGKYFNLEKRFDSFERMNKHVGPGNNDERPKQDRKKIGKWRKYMTEDVGRRILEICTYWPVRK